MITFDDHLLADTDCAVTTAETWRVVPGFDGWYDASDFGNVRTWRKPGCGVQRATDSKVLKRVNLTRIPRVCVTHPALGVIKAPVPSLVYAAFHGSISPTLLVEPINGDKADCRVRNLHLVSSESRKPRRFKRISDEVVREMRTLRNEGLTFAAIASRFDVSTPAVWFAVQRITHKAVT